MADLPQIGEDPKFVADLADVIGDDHWWECDHSLRYKGGCKVGIARAALDWLAERGRLLPPGGQVGTQWAVLGIRHGRRMRGPVVHHSLRAAQEFRVRLEADRAVSRVSYTIHQRQARIWEDGSEYYLPWSPVVSDTGGEVSNA